MWQVLCKLHQEVRPSCARGVSWQSTQFQCKHLDCTKFALYKCNGLRKLHQEARPSSVRRVSCDSLSCQCCNTVSIVGGYCSIHLQEHHNKEAYAALFSRVNEYIRHRCLTNAVFKTARLARGCLARELLKAGMRYKEKLNLLGCISAQFTQSQSILSSSSRRR